MSEADAAELLKAMVPLFRIRPIFEDSCKFGGSWESLHAPNGKGWAQFHMVTRGACVVERPGLGPQRLEAGDILLLPHGDSHAVRSRTGGAIGRVTTEVRNGVRQRATVEAEVDTELLCGRFLFETSDENPLIAAVPDEILARGQRRVWRGCLPRPQSEPSRSWGPSQCSGRLRSRSTSMTCACRGSAAPSSA